jgi:hydrogenase maturation protease
VADAVLVVGVGNVLRGDDGAGPAVARRLRERGVAARELTGEGVGLVALFEDAPAVVLVDCVRSGAAPGTVHRFDVSDAALPAGLRGSSSTHAVGAAEAIELARVLGRLPARLIVYGIEGARFDAGAPLSDAVARAVDAVVDRVAGELGAVHARRRSTQPARAGAAPDRHRRRVSGR